MSKLDDILEAFMPHMDDLGTATNIKATAKQEIKDLVLELIGDVRRDTQHYSMSGSAHRLNRNINQALNARDDELRRKVEDI